MPDPDEVLQRINEFLSVGGLFNPGETAMVNPEQTRQLMLDCRKVMMEYKFKTEYTRLRYEILQKQIMDLWVEARSSPI